MGGNTAYIFRVDPVVKGEEYDITRVINEVFPSEVTDMFNEVQGRLRRPPDHPAEQDSVTDRRRVPRCLPFRDAAA